MTFGSVIFDKYSIRSFRVNYGIYGKRNRIDNILAEHIIHSKEKKYNHYTKLKTHLVLYCWFWLITVSNRTVALISTKAQKRFIFVDLQVNVCFFIGTSMSRLLVRVLFSCVESVAQKLIYKQKKRRIESKSGIRSKQKVHKQIPNVFFSFHTTSLSFNNFLLSMWINEKTTLNQ